MNEPNSVGQTPQQRKLLALLLQIFGLSDIALGAAVAFLGPGFLGGDPTLDTVLMIVGGVLALFGAGMWWWGRVRLAAHRPGERASKAVKRMR